MTASDRKKIRASLIKQLNAAGKKNPVTMDLVEEYMEEWDRLKNLRWHYQTLQEQGMTVEDAEIAELSTQISEALTGMTNVLNQLLISPKSKHRAAMEQEIRSQLEHKGLKGDIFDDRIDAFLKLWDAFQDACTSLNTRGRTYFTISSSGKNYEKDNSASKDIVTLAKSMGDILSELDVTVDGYADPEEDEL